LIVKTCAHSLQEGGQKFTSKPTGDSGRTDTVKVPESGAGRGGYGGKEVCGRKNKSDRSRERAEAENDGFFTGGGTKIAGGGTAKEDSMNVSKK